MARRPVGTMPPPHRAGKGKKKKVARASATVACLRGLPLRRTVGKAKPVVLALGADTGKHSVEASGPSGAGRSSKGSRKRVLEPSDRSGEDRFDDSIVPPGGWYGSDVKHGLWFCETFGHSEVNLEVEAQVQAAEGLLTMRGKILRFLKNP